jgi:Undecaprenyl-phosphate glucose phosphotransferase
MSASVQVVQEMGAKRLARARLSPDIVAGIVGILDLLAVVVSGLLLAVILDRVTFVAPRMGGITLYALLLLLSLHAAGSYRFPAIMKPRRQAGTIFLVCGLVFLVLVALAFALKISSQVSRLWAFSWLLCVPMLVLTLRGLVVIILRRVGEAGRIGRRIVIYGAGLQGQRLVRRIEQLHQPWNKIVGVFDDRLSRTEPAVGQYPVLGNLADLVPWALRNRPDEVLVALPWSAEERLAGIFGTLAVLPTNVRLCSEFQRTDLVNGRVNNQYGVTMLNVYERPLAGWGRIWKKGFDIGLAGLAFVVCLPLMLLIALCIRLEGPGPILFRQKRYGFNSKVIDVCKFRTMHAGESDALGDRLTERDDPRVTRVGAVLRRLSLDELPQLLNVMRGEMSVVGPRPHAIHTTAGGRQCDEVIDHYAVRHKVKPGITGWAQVKGWRGTMVEEEHLVRRVEHDLYYINNWSPLLDFEILLRTVWVVVQGRNSY